MATKKSSRAMAGMSMPADWQTESDLRTLQEAECIKRDPMRMKACQEMAKKKLTEMAAIAGGADAD